VAAPDPRTAAGEHSNATVKALQAKAAAEDDLEPIPSCVRARQLANLKEKENDSITPA